MANKVFDKLVAHLRTIFDTESSGRLLLYAPLVGIVAGLGASGFFYLLELTQDFALGQIVGYYPPAAGDEPIAHAPQMPSHWWTLLTVPTVGGLLCGILVYGFAPEAEGHGTDGLIKAFHRAGGRIRARVPFVKTFASILTIGTGGSAGREGPIAQIGAGFGSFLSDRLGLGEHEKRMLMLAGGAGGIGAIFRSPMGGAIFVAEVLYRSTALEFTAVIPAFISSITAYAVFAALLGPGLAFKVPDVLAFHNLGELPIYLLFAVICAIVGYIYVTTFYGMRNHLFRKVPIPNMLKPAIGGLMVGIIALWLPHIMAGGYGWMQQAIDGQLSVKLLLLLCFGKIFATSLTISSGGSGGVFAPSLFIGAMLGGAFGQFAEHLFPTVVENPESFVLVGMGGFFAGVARVPLTAMLMVCEMSGSYGLLIPLMLVCIVNVAVLSSRWTLYEEQVLAMVDSPAHQGDFVIDVLEQIHVSDVMDPKRSIDFIAEELPLPQILIIASGSRNMYFPVVDSERKMIGIFSLRDLRTVLTGDRAGGLILASDLAASPVLTVAPTDDLHTALRRFTQKNIEDLPVVSPDNEGVVVGMLSRRDVINAYHDRVTYLQHPESEKPGEAAS